MADIEPPSFSLGFDFDLDLDSPPVPATGTFSGNNPSNTASKSSSAAGITTSSIVDEDDDFETPPIGRRSGDLEPAPTLKRLRRGSASSAERPQPREEKKFVVDDDIEEFSSEDEQIADAASKHLNSLCSSSKPPLYSQVPRPFLASQSARPFTETQKNNVWNPSASLHKEAHSISKPPLSTQVPGPFLDSQSARPLSESQKKNVWNPSGSSHKLGPSVKTVFPESDVSPLRRFQLIESDSDEASPSKGPNEKGSRVDLHNRNGISTFTAHVGVAGEWKKTTTPGVTSQADDLWEEIPSEMNFHIRTPVFDEMCEEHFRSVKEKKPPASGRGCHASTSFRENEVQQVAPSDATIPAHHYYHHEDFRIQQLVRARLPHFVPLSSGNNPGIKQNDASTINYMGQFNQRESSSKKKATAGSSSKKPRKNSRKAAAVDVQEESDDWITPKHPAVAAKDAGKKRVHGDCKSAGQWFTAADGKRVYVAGNGQESSGRAAYMRYKRENGGFKRSNKKAAPKKKAAQKKK